MVNKSKNQKELFPLGKCKDRILKLIEADDDIVSLIIGEGKPIIDLKNNHVYDTLVIDSTRLASKTYITMDAILVSDDTSTKCIEIILDVFTHITLINLTVNEQRKFYTSGFYGNKIDVLIDIISRLLRESDEFGIGKLQYRPRNPITIVQPHVDYYGKRIVFQMYDF